MVPLGWFLSHRLGLGTLGLFQAIFAATVVALALLAWRFQWLASRDSRGAQV
jgi:Na+-driven multidrug efflux pump